MTLRTAILILLLATAGMATPPPELAGRIERPTPAGCTDYWFLIIQLYRAELWSDATTLPGEDYGLTLTYRNAFSRRQLIETSIAEMRRISGRPAADFESFRSELTRAMHPVRRGDRYTAWRSGSGQVELFLNGESTGTLTTDGDLFLAIWLGPDTRSPHHRMNLLSGVCDD